MNLIKKKFLLVGLRLRVFIEVFFFFFSYSKNILPIKNEYLVSY